jgi:hypothetical protein
MKSFTARPRIVAAGTVDGLLDLVELALARHVVERALEITGEGARLAGPAAIVRATLGSPSGR